MEPIALTGALDQYAAEEFKSQAVPLLDGEGDAVFDLSKVDRMHAGFLQVLLALTKDLQLKGRNVVLRGVEERTREIFQVSGTEAFFTFAGGVE